MAFEISTAARDAACDAIVDLIDSGGTGTIQIRDGAQPASPNDVASGTLLATLTFSATAFGASSSGSDRDSRLRQDPERIGCHGGRHGYRTGFWYSGLR
jgi:hypothetical protein